MNQRPGPLDLVTSVPLLPISSDPKGTSDLGPEMVHGQGREGLRKFEGKTKPRVDIEGVTWLDGTVDFRKKMTRCVS